jgi:hypothetical protein
MWSSLLVLALLAALNPVRISLALLVITRPRPLQNLLAYWVGLLIVSVPALLVPLMVLHFTPMFSSFRQDLATPATATSSTVRHIQIGIGALALSIAALMTVLFFFSARRRARVLTRGGNTATLARNSNTPTAIRRLLGRAHNAWENGSLWVALMLGLASGTQADGVLYVLAIIVPSGAAFGTQVSAAIAFVVGMLAVIEIMLASYLATPAKTQAVVGLLHDWARAHRRKILVAIFGVLGVSLVAKGMGSL